MTRTLPPAFVRPLAMLLILGLPAIGLAAPKGVRIERGASTWSFDVAWNPGRGGIQLASFELPASAVKSHLSEPLQVPLGQAAAEAAAAVNSWSQAQPVPVTAKANRRGQVTLSTRGHTRPQMRKALKAASEVRDQAYSRWMKDEGFTTLRGGGISFDHARIAATSAAQVAVVAKALDPTGKRAPRGFANRALGFVQAIKYERGLGGHDKGFRHPLAALGRYRADCDGKTVLFLAIMRARYPDLRTAVVYLPGHALAAVDIPAKAGDATMRIDGSRWQLAEPVGPMRAALGIVPKRNLRRIRGGKAETRIVPG